MTSSQSKRFGTWLNLAPPQTRYLGSRVQSALIPYLQHLGFSWPGHATRMDSQPVSGRELELERTSESYFDTVTFNFDKYRRPRFQVHFARRTASSPHAFVRSCNLVANCGQYLHFWGVPWWYPKALWPNHRTDRLIELIEDRLINGVQFLSSGQTGPNVSKQLNSD